ncbi:hypothetical protein J4E93_002343 [Alternaria ventricosa]|uniref:uncharacterized protein n=1 Tax=Alternaria ventricosa TaxID=1187951 RepID=UPI0020C20488|nr:uncharacterized protein J4E93_002343 [Alternaria ventricosa]KAI4652146.1 hypothetical protein J4E93_002343 [Alternaria ventricosa]
MMPSLNIPPDSKVPRRLASDPLPQDGEFRVPALRPWDRESYNSTYNMDRNLRFMNTSILADLHGLSVVPQIYQMLFHRTREFAASVHKLVDVAPALWAEAACLLVDWGVNVLRHKEIRLDRFLHSQRESLYWILDDALLTICVDQWDPPSSHPTQPRTSSSSTPKLIPWDKATAPVTLALSRARDLLPVWAAQDLQDWEKWGFARPYTQARYMTAGWFRRSTKFLHESSRIFEIWRTMKRWGGGQLPTELANVIMEDVATSEKLPLGDLRLHYFPKDKSRAQLI